MTAVTAPPAVPALLASIAGVGYPSGSAKLHQASQAASVPGSVGTCRPTFCIAEMRRSLEHAWPCTWLEASTLACNAQMFRRLDTVQVHLRCLQASRLTC